MKHSKNKYYRLSGALMLLTLAVCAVPNVALAFTEDMSVAQRIANVLLPVGIWWLLLSLTRKIGKAVLWMFPVMFFGAFQLVLLSLYGRSVIAVDMFLNLVTTNAGEVGELLGNMAGAIAMVCALYLPPIAGGIGACVKHWALNDGFMRLNRRLSVCCIAVGLLAFGLGFASSRPYRPLADLYPLNVLYNVGLAVDRTARFGGYAEAVENYRFHSVCELPDSCRRTIVLVVGETSRADRWEAWGYERETSPGMAADTGYVYLRNTLSESNTTHKSVPMLLSHLTADTFADSLYNVRSIVSAFDEAGYSTAFFSNQRYNHSFIDSYGFEADTCLFIKERDGADHYDMELAGLLADRLQTDTASRRLIVLHTYGSHFSYADRYPDSLAYFTPDRPLEATRENRQALDNAYDNSVRYTAMLLDSITSALRHSGGESALIYTSDHGEDIFDDSRNLFLHASPAPSAHQIYVPFILWVSPELSATDGGLLKNARVNGNKQVSSSRSFFQTALHIGGISAPVGDRTLSVADSGYTAPKRRYLNDHNESVTLRGAGLREQDLDYLSRRGVATE